MDGLKQKRDSYVYALLHINRKGKNVFYIGSGTVNKKGEYDRYKRHVIAARCGSQLPVHKKIRNIWEARGETVSWMPIAKHLTKDEANYHEERAIANYGLDNLTNVSRGNHPRIFVLNQITKEVVCCRGMQKVSRLTGVDQERLRKALRNDGIFIRLRYGKEVPFRLSRKPFDLDAEVATN